jgi:hypothetical protein
MKPYLKLFSAYIEYAVTYVRYWYYVIRVKPIADILFIIACIAFGILLTKTAFKIFEL